MVTQITLKNQVTVITLIILITLKTMKTHITMTTLTAKASIKINEITIWTLNKLITIMQTHYLIIIITLGLVKSQWARRKLEI